MGSINVLFLSSVPITIQSLEEYFLEDREIFFTSSYLNNQSGFEIDVTIKHDVLILDDGALNGMEIEKVKNFITERELNKKYILLTSKADRSYLDFFIAAGVDGIISKKEEPDVIKEGILKVYNREKFLDDMIKELYTNRIDKIAANGSKKDLTAREKEVFMLVGKGYSNKEIAGEIFVDVKTIEKHKSNMMKKLKLKNTSQLFLYAALQILNMSLIFFYILPEDMF